MKISEIFSKNKIASRPTNEPERFDFTLDNTSIMVPSDDVNAGNECDCKHGEEELKNLFDDLNMPIPTKCPECDHKLNEHRSGRCQNFIPTFNPVMQTIRKRTQHFGVSLVDDTHCECGNIIAEAVRSNGTTGTPDVSYILSSLGNLSERPISSEVRRQYHESIHNVIGKILDSGSLPLTGSGGVFQNKTANAEIIQRISDSLPAESGGFISHLDSHRKQAGISMEEIGIDPSEVGDTYRISQEKTNRDYAREIGLATEVKSSNDNKECGPCKDVLNKLDDYMKRFFVSRGDRKNQEGKYAEQEWKDFIDGHERGERLPPDAHDLLKAAESTRDAWVASDHYPSTQVGIGPNGEPIMSSPAHDILDVSFTKPDGTASITVNPGRMLGSFSVRLVKPGIGERLPKHIVDAYNELTTGSSRFEPVSNRNSQLQDLWRQLLKEKSGPDSYSERDVTSLFSDKTLQKTLDYLDKFHPHLAGQFYQEDPILERTPDPGKQLGVVPLKGTNQLGLTINDPSAFPLEEEQMHLLKPTGSTRVTINTGSHIIAFHKDKIGNVIGGIYTRTPLVATQQEDRSTGVFERPFVRDIDRFILMTGLGFDPEGQEKREITDENRDSLSCRGTLVPVDGVATPFTDNDNRKFVIRARIPKLSGFFSPSNDPIRDTVDCTEHASHEFDEDGNIVSVTTRSPQTEDFTIKRYKGRVGLALKTAYPRLFEIGLKHALNQAGADLARWQRGEIDIDRRPIAGGGVAGLPGDDPRDRGPGKKDRGGPRPRTRKSSVNTRQTFNSQYRMEL